MGKKKINPLILKCRIEFSFLGYQIVSNHFDFVVSSRFHRNDNFVVILCYCLSSRKNPKDRLEFDLGSRIFFRFFLDTFKAFILFIHTMWNKMGQCEKKNEKSYQVTEKGKQLKKNCLKKIFFFFPSYSSKDWIGCSI